jgi:hypothetical protein
MLQGTWTWSRVHGKRRTIKLMSVTDATFQRLMSLWKLQAI